MKRIFTLLFACVLCANLFAQQEPKFVRDVAVLNEDGTLCPLSLSSCKILPTMNISVKGAAAENRIKQTDTLKLIVKVEKNDVSPMDVIWVYKMNCHKDSRTAFRGGAIVSSKDIVQFTGDMYGESSFIIYLVNLEMGEYGLLYSKDQIENAMLGEHKMTFFGIDRK